MSIKFEAQELFLLKRTGVVEPGTSLIIKGTPARTQVTFPTPNVAVKVVYEKFGDVKTIYDRRVLPEFVSRTFFDRLVGRKITYRWEKGTAEEDEEFAQIEKEITDHPLVGKIARAYIGEEVSGVEEELLRLTDEGWRIEDRKGDKVTTNYAWREVLVEEGKAAEVYGQSRTNPRLRVRVVDELYKDQVLMVNERNLLAPGGRVNRPGVSASRPGTQDSFMGGVSEGDTGTSGSGTIDSGFGDLAGEVGVGLGVEEQLATSFPNVPTDQLGEIERQAETLGVDLSDTNYTPDDLRSLGFDTGKITGLGGETRSEFWDNFGMGDKNEGEGEES